MQRIIDKLNEIKLDTKKISFVDTSRIYSIIDRAIHLAVKIFGAQSEYINKITSLKKKIENALLGYNDSHKDDFLTIIQMMIDEIELNGLTIRTQSDIKIKDEDKNRVFIVHGHNDLMKIATARSLEKLDLQPIILHEQANLGATIIEKFSKYSDVGFAIVLMSADDYGFSKEGNYEKAKLRARQNVLFELGFFTAKLGRSRVVAIFEDVENFEMPSDIHGVLYIPYKEGSNEWKFDLSRELLAAGYSIDLKKLV